MLFAAAAVLVACGANSTDPGPRDLPSDAAPDGVPFDGGPECDRDADGFRDEACGGDDCDDGDSTVHPGASPWVGETIPSDSGEAFAISLVADPEGRSRVAFEAGQWGTNEEEEGVLHYAERSPGGWIRDELFRGIIGAGSLAIDESGRAHLLFEGSGWGGYLAHGFEDGGAWETEPLDEGGNNARLAAGSGGTLHAAWVNFDGGLTLSLVHAVLDGESWIVENVDLGANPPPHAVSGLEVEQSGSPQIVYTSWEAGTATSVHVTLVGTTWSAEPIDVAGECSLALDPEQTPHVACVEQGGAIRYGRREARGWSSEDLGTTGRSWPSIDIEVDESSVVHIAILGGDPYEFRYVENGSGSWSTEQIDDESYAEPDLELTWDTVHVAYASREGFRYATRSRIRARDVDCDGEPD